MDIRLPNIFDGFFLRISDTLAEYDRPIRTNGDQEAEKERVVAAAAVWFNIPKLGPLMS
jgi:hypothetical protein